MKISFSAWFCTKCHGYNEFKVIEIPDNSTKPEFMNQNCYNCGKMSKVKAGNWTGFTTEDKKLKAQLK